MGTYYLLVARNYEKAIENYHALLQRYPADSAAHGNLGMAYMLTGNPERAVTEAREVLKILSEEPEQRRNLALYLMYRGAFKKRDRRRRADVSETPSYAIGYLPVALSMLANGDIDGAVKTYDRLEASGAVGSRLARLGGSTWRCTADGIGGAATHSWRTRCRSGQRRRNWRSS